LVFFGRSVPKFDDFWTRTWLFSQPPEFGLIWRVGVGGYGW